MTTSPPSSLAQRAFGTVETGLPGHVIGFDANGLGHHRAACDDGYL